MAQPERELPQVHSVVLMEVVVVLVYSFSERRIYQTAAISVAVEEAVVRATPATLVQFQDSRPRMRLHVVAEAAVVVLAVTPHRQAALAVLPRLPIIHHLEHPAATEAGTPPAPEVKAVSYISALPRPDQMAIPVEAGEPAQEREGHPPPRQL